MIEESAESPGDPPAAGAPSKNIRRVRPAALALGLAVGLALVIVAVLAFAILTGDRMPRLTEADYKAALARWEAHGPADYNLDLELAGNRPGKIHVEVRAGQVVHMTRDGVEPKQIRTWDYWTVPGQLDTIGEELEMARDPAASFNSPDATQMVMWAEFDPKYGYPKRYDRVVLGTDFETHWKVTRFESLPPDPGSKP
jgi:Family of unknown function (DUF6174)